MDHDKRRYRLIELAPGVTAEEVISKTEAEILVDEKSLKPVGV
jgi:acyl CoA:acetate/3-ketoacid CoA transferase beta subunit